jgi:hypothetical protein
MFVRAPGENFRSPFGSRPGVGRDNFCDRKTARVGRTVIGVMTIHFSAVARPDEITDARLFVPGEAKPTSRNLFSCAH